MLKVTLSAKQVSEAFVFLWGSKEFLGKEELGQTHLVALSF